MRHRAEFQSLQPQNMSSRNDTKPSDMLKEEGNSLFKAGKIMGAFLKYNEAHMKLSKLDGTHDIIYKRAVLLSNRSNCLFELGKYEKSSDDARKCIILLEDASSDNKELPLSEQCESLKRKNLLRIARCGIYGEDLGNTNSTSYNKNIAEPLQYLSTCGDAAYEKRALRMMSQVRNLREDALEKNRLGDDLPFLPSIHRESVYGSFVREYYNYGHDHVTSALTPGHLAEEESDTPSCPPIELSKLPEPHLSNLSLLFGGVGDARHVYTTLIDIHRQWKCLDHKKKDKFHIDIVVNDINPTAVARDILMIAALVRLGRLSCEYGDCQEPQTEAFRLAVMLQYTFFGYAHPESVHQTVMSIIDDLISEDFASLKEFILASDDIWSTIKSIMSYWRNAEEGADFFPTTADSLNIFQGTTTSWEDPGDDSNNSRRMRELQEENRQTRENHISDIENMTLEELSAKSLDIVRSKLPSSERNNDDRLLSMAKEILLNDIELDPNDFVDAQNGATSRGRIIDHNFMSKVNAILPPTGCAGPLYDQIWEIWETQFEPEEYQLLMNKANNDVRSTWKVNRTMFDPKYTKFLQGKMSKNQFNPIAEIGQYFLHTHCMPDYLEQSPSKFIDLDFFQCTSLFFWSTSRALSNLLEAKSISFELNFEAITDFCRLIQDTTPQRKFHRILLSNIPDYIGLLSVFTEVSPLLHFPSEAIPTFIQCNVLYNTSIWESYSQYVYSATGISSLSGVAKVLGMKYLNMDDIFTSQNQWTWVKDWSQASRNELTSWLHQVMLISLLPPMKNPFQLSTEQCPMNFATFMRVCTFCIETLRYPSHWIGGILDDIIAACSTGILKTFAEIPSSSPMACRSRAKTKQINVKAFRTEILTQVGLWSTHFRKYLIPMSSQRFSIIYQKYKLVLRNKSGRPYLKVTRYGNGGAGGRTNTMCLGFVLSYQENPDGLDPSPFASVFHQGLDIGEGNIRAAAIEGGPLQIFSCMAFGLDEETKNFFMEFCLSENDFQRYSNYYIYPIRTDSWTQVGYHNSMRLRDAHLSRTVGAQF